MDCIRSLRRFAGLFAWWIAGLAGATVATAQGTTASLSDAGMQIDSTAPSVAAETVASDLAPTASWTADPSRTGVHTTLSDRTGFTWVAPSPAVPATDVDRSQGPVLPQLSGSVQIPFEQIATSYWAGRPSADQQVESRAASAPLDPHSSPIQVFPTERGSAAAVHPASLRSSPSSSAATVPARQPTPPRVGQQERDYFQDQESSQNQEYVPSQEAEPRVAPETPVTSEPELSAAPSVAGPLPQMREMFSFSTASPNPIQVVAARQPPLAGLPAMLKISVDGPRSVAVGETATFTVTTENVGHQPAAEVYLVVEQGRDVRIIAADPAPAEHSTRGVKIYLGSLDGGSLRAVSVQVTAQQAGPVRLRCRTESRPDQSRPDPRTAAAPAAATDAPASASR